MTANVFLKKHFEVLSSEFDLYLVANLNSGTLNNQISMMDVYNLNIPRNISLFKDLLAFVKLVLFLKKNKFDIVHTITPKAGLIGMIASYICRVEYRIHIFTGQVWYTKKGFIKLLLIFFDKVIVKLATQILVDGESQRKFLLRNNIVTNEKSIVLGRGSISGVDISKFYPHAIIRQKKRKELNFHDNQIVFSFLGRLNKDKGVIDLVKAFLKLKSIYDNVKLMIIGVDEENIIEYVKNNFPSSDIFFIEYSEKPEELLQASDVFCMPSYREGFGTSVIEASSLGIPVISSDTYGLCDAFIDNQTGLKHVTGNYISLFEKMEMLLLNENLRCVYGENGRTYVSTYFNSDLVTNNWLLFYKNFL